MNLTISGHHVEVTPALREYVMNKLERPTRHLEAVSVDVLLSVEMMKGKNRLQKAEVTFRVKGKEIFVEQSHVDLYAAIDQLMDKLDRQVCRYKEILKSARGRNRTDVFLDRMEEQDKTPSQGRTQGTTHQRHSEAASSVSA